MYPNGETNGPNVDGPKPYDLTTIYAISENNAPFLEKLLLVFADTTSIDRDAIKIAAAENNWSRVGEIAHKMKSSIAHFGVDSIKDTLKILEHPENRDTEQLNLLVIKLDNTINDILFHLSEEFPNVFNK